MRILTQLLKWRDSEIECNTKGQLSTSANAMLIQIAYISTSLGREWRFSCVMSVGTFLMYTQWFFFCVCVWWNMRCFFSCLVWIVCLCTHLSCVALCSFYCLWRRRCSIYFFLFHVLCYCCAKFMCQKWQAWITKHGTWTSEKAGDNKFYSSLHLL